jgi:hypothetical protein
MECFHFSFNYEGSSAGYSNLGWQLFYFRVWKTSFHALLAFRVFVEKSAVILSGLPLDVTWCFSLASFNVLSLFYIFCVLIIICLGEVLFWSCLFGVLKASCTLVSISFSKFGKFSFIMLLNVFCTFSFYPPFSVPMIHRFCLLMVSQRFCMFQLYFLIFSYHSLSVLIYLHFLQVLILSSTWSSLLMKLSTKFFYLTYWAFHFQNFNLIFSGFLYFY